MSFPVTVDNQIKIRNSWEALCDDLDIGAISSSLISRGILTVDYCEEILEDRITLRQNEKFLKFLLSSNDECFKNFVSYLQEEKAWLAEGLESHVVTEVDRQKHIDSVMKQCTLPQKPVCFVGRSEDIKRITDALLDRPRLAVIKGFGGQGKTALATVIGYDFVLRWGIRAILVDMSKVSTEEDIPDAVYFAMKIKKAEKSFSTSQRLVRNLCEEISSYGKKILLILDNCEGALGETTQKTFLSMIQEINVNCPNAYILCTTRDKIQIPNMAVPEHPLESLSQSASFSLLQSYSPSLKEDGDTLDLIKRCGFVALQLHIIGHLLGTGCTTAELLEELAHSIFTGATDEMRECINLTYKRLGPNEQKACIFLSLLSSTFTADQADALLKEGIKNLPNVEYRRIVNRLCDSSLLTYDITNQVYSMHSVIQAFAIKEIPLELDDTYRQGFMRFMEPYVEDLLRMNDEEAKQILMNNTANLRNYFAFAFALTTTRTCTNETESHMLNYVKIRSLYIRLAKIFGFVGAYYVLETLLGIRNKRPTKDDEETAIRYMCMGLKSLGLEDSTNGISYLKAAVNTYEGLEAVCKYIFYYACCYFLGCCFLQASEHTEALEWFAKCHSLSNIHDNKTLDHHSQSFTALIKAKQGDQTGAMAILQEILDSDPSLDENEGDMDCIAGSNAQQNMGVWKGSLPMPMDLLLFEEMVLDIRINTIGTLINIGKCLSFTGDPKRAETFLRRALTMTEKGSGEDNQKATGVLHELALAISSQRNHREILSVYQRALRIDEQVLVESASKSSTLHCIGLEMLNLGYQDGAVDVFAIRKLACAMADQGNHTEALSAYQKELRINEKVLGECAHTASLLHRIGQEMLSLDDPNGAVDVFKKALAMKEKCLGENHESTAVTIQELARAMSAQGNHTEALSTYQRALRINEQVLGETESTAKTIHRIGQEMLSLDDPNGAVDVFKKALAMLEKCIGENQQSTAATIHEFARAMSAQGNHTEALSTYQRALRINEQVLGESESTAITIHCIGQKMLSLGDTNGAVDVFKRALAMQEKCLGENHESTAVTLHELALAISAQGNHTEALGTYQRALRIKEQVLGESKSTAKTIHCIGQEMLSLGDPNDAVDIFKRALAMKMKCSGENHESTAVTIHEFARAMSAQGNHTEALSTYQRALRIYEQVLGESESTAKTIHRIGQEMLSLDDPNGAVDAFKKALAMKEKCLGENNESTAATIHGLARAMSAQENHIEALSTYQRALRINEQVLGESESTAKTIHRIGQEMLSLGDTNGAVDVFKRALAMKEKCIGENHKSTAKTINELARAMSAQGNHTEALSTYQRALRICEQVLVDSPRKAATLHRIRQEMLSLGDPDTNHVYTPV